MKFPLISIESVVQEACPDIRLGCLMSQVKVQPAGPKLQHFIQKELEQISAKLALENIHDLPSLHATRTAYKALGKDPSRYRPSAEALLRRVVQGKGLYEVSNVVDALNLISVKTGFSIGGYDAEKINGEIRLGRGAEDEPYEAIGRGTLNIHGLPVLRDGAGAFGSPTSDSLRTMVTPETQWFLAVFFDFEKSEMLQAVLEEFGCLLAEFAGGNAEFLMVNGSTLSL